MSYEELKPVKESNKKIYMEKLKLKDGRDAYVNIKYKVVSNQPDPSGMVTMEESVEVRVFLGERTHSIFGYSRQLNIGQSDYDKVATLPRPTIANQADPTDRNILDMLNRAPIGVKSLLPFLYEKQGVKARW
jgi:hypothetical protein